LCESVVGKRKMLLVTGGGISAQEPFWKKLRNQIGLPMEWAQSSSKNTESQRSTSIGASVQIPMIVSGKGDLGSTISQSVGTTELRNYTGPDGVELLNYITSQGYTIVVDDFHYISKDVQKSLAEQFKEAARAGATIVVVSVSHRSDQAIRANPDLRGRVVSIDIPYWKREELKIIAEKGFPYLNINISPSLIENLTAESVSSPQLMQALCLQLCREKNIEEKLKLARTIDFNAEEAKALFKNTTSLANCQTAFDIIKTGPKPRGSERKTYSLSNGISGDIYYVILKALAHGEPLLSLPYATIKDRVEQIVPHDPPRGVGIIQAVQQMHKSVNAKLGEDRVLDWDEEKEIMNINDPYFLYYLRWAI